MNCANHKSLIEDAATDALDLRQEAQLNAHLEACAACRDLLARERDLFAAIDSTLMASVNGEPSPYFAARVRASLAHEPPRSAGFIQWLPLTAGALVVVAAIGFWIFRSGSGHSPADIVRQPQPPPVQATPPPVPPASNHLTAQGNNLPPRAPQPFPVQVLVAPEEKAGFRRLVEFARTQRLSPDAMPNVAEMRKPLGTPELKIEPLETAALGLQPPAPADVATPAPAPPRR